jgi:hypothetical protein
MGLQKLTQGIKHRADRSDSVCHGRQSDRHAFKGVALGLAVQGLMLTELLEHDHGQEAGPRPSPRDDMEWRRRLRDLLTVATGELLPHGLDHLPLPGDRFQRAGHILAKFAQAMAATALTRRRCLDHHALAGKMIGERIALETLARKSVHSRCLGNRFLGRELIFSGAGFQLFERERELINQARRAFRSLSVDLTLQFGDPQLLLGD